MVVVEACLNVNQANVELFFKNNLFLKWKSVHVLGVFWYKYIVNFFISVLTLNKIM
jgi:hypothetical protein